MERGPLTQHVLPPKAYWVAYRNGADETKSNLAAAEAFFEALMKDLTFLLTPCAAATKAFTLLFPESHLDPML